MINDTYIDQGSKSLTIYIYYLFKRFSHIYSIRSRFTEVDCVSDCLDYLHDLHDHGDPSAGEHVDCHDGEHLPAGQRDPEGVVQTGESGVMLHSTRPRRSGSDR